ncbi:unnamed protein product [Arabidopsis lyrata]|uniref:Uncharacterized protein n=1 Tax=Arabidopsis lyrata subsp. lyrata TaxID=81972 RepID=D7KTM3_ARALL|nr:uncharacterized protein LOC9324555 [Arabidopsis lyrata subsp. lyrata]EFH63277.1 hypothetical protein ARALYDRAFT_894264 [Arabidopsis lyrata subsp. lyrata]CAH8257157.1 unnamed protein product [Arabidopsis lyrata]|eukprot:XP_002887018.1 uncharacterized protein LOC9324555 [Arabidopsis lyrata subsp. lyrata]
MSFKFILITMLILLCIASSNSTITPFSRNRKIIVEEGGKIHIHKGKKITVKPSRSPPAKGTKNYTT